MLRGTTTVLVLLDAIVVVNFALAAKAQWATSRSWRVLLFFCGARLLGGCVAGAWLCSAAGIFSTNVPKTVGSKHCGDERWTCLAGGNRSRPPRVGKQNKVKGRRRDERKRYKYCTSTGPSRPPEKHWYKFRILNHLGPPDFAETAC